MKDELSAIMLRFRKIRTKFETLAMGTKIPFDEIQE